MSEDITAVQAVEALGAFTRIFRAAQHLEKAAQWAANMERVEVELKAAVQAQRDALGAAQAEAEQAKADVAAERQKAKDMAKKAEARAASIIEDAEVKALQITAGADAYRETANAEVEVAQELVNSTNALRELAEEELAATQAKLADARAAIANLLGSAAA